MLTQAKCSNNALGTMTSSTQQQGRVLTQAKHSNKAVCVTQAKHSNRALGTKASYFFKNSNMVGQGANTS